MVRTEDFLLPVHWAPYLIYGDESGYTPAEIGEIQEWEIAHAPGPCIGCGNDAELSYLGDEGVGACERCTFTFQVIDAYAAYVDGEVVAWH